METPVGYIVYYKEYKQEGTKVEIIFKSETTNSESRLKTLKQNYPNADILVVNSGDSSRIEITKEELQQEIDKQEEPLERFIPNMLKHIVEQKDKDLLRKYIPFLYKMCAVRFYWYEVKNFEEVAMEILKDMGSDKADHIVNLYNQASTLVYEEMVKEALG